MRILMAFLSGERRSLGAWSFGVGAYVFLMGAIWGAMPDKEALAAAYEQGFGEQLGDLFGDVGALATVEGFLRLELGTYMSIVLGIFAATTMTRHLAGAEETGRLDHWLARPIDRAQYYWHAVATGGIVLTAVILAGAVGGVAGFAVGGASGGDLLGVVGYMLDFLPVSLVSLGLGAFLGAAFHRRSVATGLSVLVVFVFFVLDIAARLVEDLEWMRYATPNWYHSESDLFDGRPDGGYLAFSAALATAFAWAGGAWFDRKDLHA